MDAWFSIGFDSGVVVQARLCEESLVAAFYTNTSIYESAGPEMCIALDVALAAGGCEAVVEGFYSLMKAHKRAGGQGNEILVKRVVVDWSIPDPLSCPNTCKKSASFIQKVTKSWESRNICCLCSQMKEDEQKEDTTSVRLLTE